jgi:hypothetical protein
VTVELLPWIVAGVSLLALFAAVIASTRSQRQLMAAHEESIATKNEQIAALEAQLASLRESESIRFVDRYVAAKNGLEERVRGLQEQLETARDQQDQLRGELADLGLSDRERESEAERLRRDLMRTNDQVRRLEVAIREVASVGPLDVNTIRVELDGRRELAAHIKERLDRLNLETRDRVARRLSRTHRLERLQEDVARVRREIEITRAASSIVDGILGIDTETRRRLARHASDRIEGALQALGDASRRSPISQFVDLLEEQRPDRLLERGGRTSGPGAEREAERDTEPAVDRTSPPPASSEPRIEQGPGSGGAMAAGSRPEDRTGAGAEHRAREAYRSPAV